MKQFVVVDELGLIKTFIRGSFNEVLQTCHLMGMGYDPIEVSRRPSPEVEYIVGGAIEDRPRMVNLRVSGRKVYGIPEGSSLSWDSITHHGVGGEVELEFDGPGPHHVKVSCGVFVEETLEVI